MYHAVVLPPTEGHDTLFRGIRHLDAMLWVVVCPAGTQPLGEQLLLSSWMLDMETYVKSEAIPTTLHTWPFGSLSLSMEYEKILSRYFIVYTVVQGSKLGNPILSRRQDLNLNACTTVTTTVICE